MAHTDKYTIRVSTANVPMYTYVNIKRQVANISATLQDIIITYYIIIVCEKTKITLRVRYRQ